MVPCLWDLLHVTGFSSSFPYRRLQPVCKGSGFRGWGSRHLRCGWRPACRGVLLMSWLFACFRCQVAHSDAVSEESASEEGKGSPRHSKEGSTEGLQAGEAADIEMGPVGKAAPEQDKGSLPSEGDAPLHKGQLSAGLPGCPLSIFTCLNFT